MRSTPMLLLVVGLLCVAAQAQKVEELVIKDPVLGDPVSITAGGQSVDLFLLADNTGSMGAEIADVQDNAQLIYDSLSAVPGIETLNVGVGAYKDAGDDFFYKTIVPLTPVKLNGSTQPAGQATVTSAINQWEANGGGDQYEAQILALFVTSISFIGWGADSRIVAWFGDQPGKDPSPPYLITMPQTINALNLANICVLAIDVNNLNGLNQATDIVDGTCGTYTFTPRNGGGGGGGGGGCIPCDFEEYDEKDPIKEPVPLREKMMLEPSTAEVKGAVSIAPPCCISTGPVLFASREDASGGGAGVPVSTSIVEGVKEIVA